MESQSQNRHGETLQSQFSVVHHLQLWFGGVAATLGCERALASWGACKKRRCADHRSSHLHVQKTLLVAASLLIVLYVILLEGAIKVDHCQGVTVKVHVGMCSWLAIPFHPAGTSGTLEML